MKKLILLVLLGYSVSSFAQEIVKNGIIYKSHPNITTLNTLGVLFAKGDTTEMAKLFADTAKFYPAPEYKPKAKGYTLAEEKAHWNDIFANWNIIEIKPVGYPDGLDYVKEGFVVQSWWKVTIANKKTQKQAVFQEVIFDSFNKDGKITLELSYYDTAAIVAAMQ